MSIGRIEVIYGPMFSGKSSELLRLVKRFQHARKNCLVLNYLHDNRYSSDELMSTHDRYLLYYPGKLIELSKLIALTRSKIKPKLTKLWPLMKDNFLKILSNLLKN